MRAASAWFVVFASTIACVAPRAPVDAPRVPSPAPVAAVHRIDLEALAR
ncbi:MAG: hypothetical protein H6825_05835 [Planctomycetes bacterium]|nr:hypothetical protein [Planctomycetota bacterium]